MIHIKFYIFPLYHEIFYILDKFLKDRYVVCKLCKLSFSYFQQSISLVTFSYLCLSNTNMVSNEKHLSSLPSLRRFTHAKFCFSSPSISSSRRERCICSCISIFCW